ncbi:MAG: tail fiber assembly protein [Plesiomonas sp.]
MIHAKLDSEGIAAASGYITVFNYNTETREYIGSSIEYLAIGIGLPANSHIDKPPENKTGFAVCRAINDLSWEYLPDHRGDIVYSTITSDPIEITLPGEYPDNTTPLKPKTPYDYWDDIQWVTDIDADHTAAVAKAEAEKTKLLSAATQKINLWQMQLQLGIITDANKEKLIEWIKYIEAVQAIDTNTAPNITWPVQPEE